MAKTVEYSIGASNKDDVTLTTLYVGDYLNVYSYNNVYGVAEGNSTIGYGEVTSDIIPGCSFELVKASVYECRGTVTTAGTYRLRIRSSTDYFGTVTVIVKNVFTVTYNSQGGSSTPAAVSVNEGSSTTLPSPGTKSGYEFSGWYTAASGGTRVGGNGSSYKPTANVTLYAQWVKYVVTYNANGGTVSPTSVTVDVGSSITLPTPTQDGFEFNGWYTASTGGTKVGNAGASYKPTSNITLYAQWTATGTYVFSAKYDRISADQILDNVGKTITTVQNKLHEYITSLGGVTYTNSSGVFSYSLPVATSTKSFTVTLPGAEVVSANNKEHASADQIWKVVYTLPAESYASYHSMNNIVTSLNALKTHYNSMKHAKVTQVSMSAMFMALASLLSSLTYHRARFVDRTILRSNVQTTAVAGGSVTPTVSVANITNWGNNISAIAHATAEQSTEVFNISGNGSAAFTSSSCSSSSSSSCCSSSCSSSSCSSSCSCFFVVFYNLGGL